MDVDLSHVTIQNDVYGHHHRQTVGSLYAMYDKDTPIAKLDYSIFEGVIQVDWIETHESVRRYGMATMLMDHLKKMAEEEGLSIKHSLSTVMGTEFLDTYQGVSDKQTTQTSSWRHTFKKSQIEQPYYRVVCPACYGTNNGGDAFVEGTYWTPRWNAVQSMLQTVLKFWSQSGKTIDKLDADAFRVKVYKVTDAVMQDAPKEHSWAFNYPSDAGEQVLIKLLSTPELILDKHASDSDFAEIAFQDFEREQDYSAVNEKYEWQGQEVYLSPNYDRRVVIIAKRNEDGWSFSEIDTIKNLSEYEAFMNSAKQIETGEQWTGALEYFISDMGWLPELASSETCRYKYAEEVTRNPELLAKIRSEYLSDLKKLSTLFADTESVKKHKQIANQLEQFREWSVEQFGPGNQHMRNHISDYANTNPSEAYAEAFMNTVLGKSVDPSVQDWFTRVTHIASSWTYTFKEGHSGSNKWRHKFAQITGEWFIDSNGHASFADGDIGDVNHEIVAMQSMIGDERLSDRFSEAFYAGGEPLTSEEREEIELYEPGFLEHMESRGEARDWVIEKHNWIRVHGNNFQLFRLDSDAVSRVASFLGEQITDDDVHGDQIDQEEVYIQEDSTGSFNSFEASQIFEAAGNPEAMTRLLLNLRRPSFASNWTHFFKAGQQQYFPFHDPTTDGIPQNWTNPHLEEELSLADIEEELQQLLDTDADINTVIIPFLDKYSIEYDMHSFPTGKIVMTIDASETIIVEQSVNDILYWDEVHDWIDHAEQHAHEYYPEVDESEEFWSGVGEGFKVYHGTNDDRVADIQSIGIESRDETRGIENRSTGAAVFASLTMEEAEPYYTHIFSINLGAMKAAGYMPRIGMETPIEEHQIRQSLAHGIGQTDYHEDVEGGLSEETVVIYGDIPAQFIELEGNTQASSNIWHYKFAETPGQREYLLGLGASPEIVEWILSQPNPQSYINQFRQKPGIGIDELSAFQPKQKKGPTIREQNQVEEYEPFFQRWALMQLRKMRMKPSPFQGNIDYDYRIPIVAFNNYLSQIHDWYSIVHNNPDDIFSFSWDQAKASSDEWHAVAAGKGSGKVYEPTNPDLVVFQPKEWEGWSIQRVMSENDLLAEGNLMNHCVGEFCIQVERGDIEVYSLRDPQNHPHVTIGIDNDNTIVQLQGNSNKDPDEEYKVYLRQWLPKLQKEKPGLSLDEQPFDFDDLKYENEEDIDQKINSIVFNPNDYGLAPNLGELDVEDAYAAVLSALAGNNMRNDSVRNVGHIGPVIAQIAWAADKQRAKDLGLLAVDFAHYNENVETYSDVYSSFKRKSSNIGVDWLWEKIQGDDMTFLDYFDYESYLDRNDFENEEEYEKARDQEQYDYENEARNQHLPYALNDEIARELVSLQKSDSFLKNFTETPTMVASQKTWLQKTAGIQLMYHGTSSDKLSSILSEGLNTHHETVWDEEKGRRDHDRSMQSYGGTYFTNNFMSAVSAGGNAAEKFVENRRDKCIVVAQLELRTPSILIDEDHLPNPLRAINTAFRINANDYWMTWWVSEGCPDIDKAVVEYFREINLGTQYLTPYVEEYIKASAAREAVVAIETSKEERERNGYSHSSYDKKYPHLDIGRGQAESNVMISGNALMQKMQDKANQQTDAWNNSVRVLEPVSFRGKNKIVLVTQMNEKKITDRAESHYIEDKYYVDFIVLYNKSQQAIDMLIKDATKALSHNIRVRDQQGNVFYDEPREEKARPA